MIVGLTGSRRFSDFALLRHAVERLYKPGDVYEFHVGDCPTGLDAMAYETMRPCVKHVADWDRYGKAAGPLRNQKMVDEIDELVAFMVRGQPNIGTKDTITRAQKKGISVFIFTEFS